MNEDQIIKSLRSAGVAKEYRSREISLSSVFGDKGISISNGFKHGTYQELASLGSVWPVLGHDRRARDWMNLLCRAFHLHGVSSRMVSLRQLLDLLEGDELDPIQLLLINQWYDPSYQGAFSPTELSRMDWWFQRWLFRGNSLVLNCTSGRCLTDASVSSGGWWSSFLVSMLLEKQITVLS